MLAQYFSTACMEMTKPIRNCCWNGLSRMREEPAHLLSQVKGHQQSKQRLMVFKLTQIHFSEIRSVEKINKPFSHRSESKHREKLSVLLLIRAGAGAEALPRTPHCQALDRGQPWSHSHCTGTHCCHCGSMLVPPPLSAALFSASSGKGWAQPRGADDNKAAAWRKGGLSWRTKLPLALHRTK